jgi:hypothetical protein
MVNRMRPVLTEHLRTAGGANCTQIARPRPRFAAVTKGDDSVATGSSAPACPGRLVALSPVLVLDDVAG